jgi:uncharacterized protein (TIGR02246 family)
MKRVLTASMLALTLAAACTKADIGTPEAEMGTAQQPPSFTAGDEAEVRGLVASFAEAWNRYDMDAMHALDTDDVEWVNVVGNHWRGVADVRRGHTNMFNVPVFKNTLKVEAVDLRAITPDVAILVTTLHFGPAINSSGKGTGDQRSTGSFTAVKRSGVWKLVHFQNTIIDPLAEGAGDPVNWDKTGVPPQLMK